MSTETPSTGTSSTGTSGTGTSSSSNRNWAASKQWLQCRWPVDEAAAMAVYLEASAPKAGNVTPSATFHDMDYSDFLVSGLALREAFGSCGSLTTGELVLQAIEATHRRQPTNTNLGTVLLLAPLAKAVERLATTRLEATHVEIMQSLQASLASVLSELTPDDARHIYAAIRLAKPGGMGRTSEHDVHGAPPDDLLVAMQSAAAIDAVARQYVNGFADVCPRMLLWLIRGLARGLNMSDLVAEIQLRWLATEPDGLIVRKAGREVAAETQQLAAWALDEWLETGSRGVRWQALDVFLRTDDHSRNPGTTADLIAAALFALLCLAPLIPSTNN